MSISVQHSLFIQFEMLLNEVSVSKYVRIGHFELIIFLYRLINISFICLTFLYHENEKFKRQDNPIGRKKMSSTKMKR